MSFLYSYKYTQRVHKTEPNDVFEVQCINNKKKKNLPILHIGKTLRDVPTTNSKSNSYCSKAATHYKDLLFSKNDNASESVVAQRGGTLEIKGLSHRSVVSSFVDVPAYPLLLKDNAGKEPCYMRQEACAVNILQTQGHFKKC